MMGHLLVPESALETYLEQCWRPIMEAEAFVLMWWAVRMRRPLERARYQRMVNALLRARRHGGVGKFR